VSGPVLSLISLPWLLAVARQDARTRQVGNWLTVPPLFAGALLWLWRGKWQVAVLLVGLLLIADLLHRRGRSLAMGLGPGLLLTVFLSRGTDRDMALVLVAWFCAWAAWIMHLVGGADAKVLMALVAFMPDFRLLALLFGAQITWSIYHLALRYKKQALRVALAGALSRPTEDELNENGVSLLPAWAAAGAIFCLWQWIGG
jgi:Flp pilus assembly protein protease CpaA